MNPSDRSQASWRKARVRGCALLFAALVMLWSSAASAQQTYTLTLLPSTLQSATKNIFFSQQITAVGGNGNYTYNLKPGDSLPPGITFSNSGLLSGTPTSSNTYTFTLEAVDNGGGSGNRPYTTFSVGAPNSITINPGSLPDGTPGVGYSQTLTTQNSSGGNVFSISGGSLPPGLSLNSSTGDITGTPNTGGTFNFTVHVLDSDGDTGTQDSRATSSSRLSSIPRACRTAPPARPTTRPSAPATERLPTPSQSALARCPRAWRSTPPPAPSPARQALPAISVSRSRRPISTAAKATAPTT